MNSYILINLWINERFVFENGSTKCGVVNSEADENLDFCPERTTLTANTWILKEE